MSFHRVDDKTNHREAKPSRWCVEIKGQLNPLFQVNIKLEVIEIDYYGPMFSIHPHLFNHSELVEKT